jgi:hypothetical protein
MNIKKKWNKKSMIKIGVVSFVVILLIVILLLVNLSSAVIEKEKYVLGEKVKIDLRNYENYELKIITPSETIIKKGSDETVIFEPHEIGRYKIEIVRGIQGIEAERKLSIHSRQTEEYYFEVVETGDDIDIVNDSDEADDGNISGEVDNEVDKEINNKTGNINNTKLVNQTEEIEEVDVGNDIKIINIGNNSDEVIVGKPVKWKKKINFGKIEIPESAYNISVSSGEREIDYEIKDEIEETEKSDKVLSISSEKNDNNKVINKEIIILENVSEDVEIEYYTEGPKKTEQEMGNKNKKEVVVYSDDGVEYENVTAFTEIMEVTNKKENIRVYWKEEDLNLNFEAFDRDEDGLLDYIEWIVPHLSNQTFEIIIIIKAEHLNESRDFVEDIYDEVKSRDGVWSEIINSGEYVRVRFEKNLTSENDITVYPRIVSGNPRIEVYEIDKSEKIAEFSSLNENEYNKVFLTGLLGSQDNFDLRIVNGSAEFDHIIDPDTVDFFYYTGWEVGEDGWVDPGQDSDRYSGLSRCYDNGSLGGSWSWHLQDDSTTSYTARNFNFSGYENVTISFSGYYTSIEVGECLDLRCDGTTVWSYCANEEGTEDQWLDNCSDGHCATIFPANCTFDSSVEIRFEAEFSANQDDVYIDCINMSGVIPDAISPEVTIVRPEEKNYSTSSIEFNVSLDEQGSCNYTLNNGVTNYTMSSVDGQNFNATNTSIGDGKYTVGYYCWDPRNNMNDSETRNFEIDTTHPGLVMTSPQNISYNSNISLGLNYSAADTNRQTCWYNLDLGSNITLTGCQNTTFNVSQGSHALYLFVNDSAGNTNTTNVTFFIDSMIPEIDYGFGTEDDGEVIGGDTIFINVTVNETNEVNITFLLYNSTGEAKREVHYDETRAQSWNLLPDGIYFYNVTVVDILNNKNTTQTRNLTLDNVAPVVSFENPTESDGKNASQNFIFVNVSIVEDNFENITYLLYNESGLVNITNYTTAVSDINWTNLDDGKYYYNVTVFDKTGKNDSTETRVIRLDTKSPLIEYGFGTADNNSNFSRNWIFVNVTVNETNEANITFRLFNNSGMINESIYYDGTRTINWTNLGDGNYTYNVSIFDYIENFNSTKTRTVRLDTTAPNITINSPEFEGIYYSSSLVNFNITLNENGDKCWYNIAPGPLFNYSMSTTDNRNYNGSNSFSDFEYTVTYYCNDSFGNIGTNSRGFGVDTVYPLIEFEDPTEPDGNNKSQNWIYAKVSVVENNEVNITFRLYNDSGEVNVSFFNTSVREINWTNLDNGFYYYNVTVIDKANNKNTTETNQIGLDTEGPVITILHPETKVYGYNESLPLNYTVSDNLVGYENCWWNLDNNPNQSIQCGQNTTFNTSDGSHTLYFYSNDSLNNLGFSTKTFSVSTQGPAITLDYPGNDSYFNATGVIQFNYTPLDPDGADTCELYGNWSGGWHMNQSNDTIQNGSTNTFNVNMQEENTFIWNIWCNDSLSWYSFALNNFTFGIDLTSPLISYGSGLADNGANVSRNWIFVNVTVNESNEANITFLLYNTTGQVDKDTYSDGRRTRNWTGLSDGIYYYNVTIIDKANWRNSTGTRHIRLDTTPPNGTLISPLNETYTNITQQNLTVNASDENYLSNLTLYIFNETGSLIYENFQVVTGTLVTVGMLYTFLYDGIFTWFYEIVDVAGNVFNTPNNTLIIDTTYPEINYTIGTADNGANVSRNWIFVNVTVNETNEANITFLLYNTTGQVDKDTYSDGRRTRNWTGLSEGIYYYNVTLTDLVNQKNTTETYVIRLDTVVPGVTIVRPEEKNYSISSIDFNVTIDEQGKCNYTLNSGQTNYTMSSVDGQNFNATNTSIGDGQYLVRYYCIDVAGNLNDSETKSFGVDSTNPGINYTFGTEDNDTYFTRNWIFVNVTVNETNFANLTFLLYNTTGQVSKIPYSDQTRDINWTNLDDGRYYYNVTAVDFANNKNTTETRTITLDNVGPVINFENPTEPNGKNASNNWIFINVSVIEDNPANITYLLYNLTGEVDKSVFTMQNQNSNSTINWTNLEDGKYYYNVTIVDEVGSKNSTETRVIRLDALYPGINYTIGTESNGTEFERKWIFVNVTINETNFENITFELYNTTSLVNRTIYNTAITSINWTNLQSGNITYYYNVSIRDWANNFNSTETRTIKLIDTQNPLLVMTDPQNTTYNYNNSLPLNYITSDDNIDSCWYNLDGGANQTISNCQNTTFDTSDFSSHTLYLFVNDTLGQTNQTQVTFFVNTSYIITNYWKVMRDYAITDGQQDVTIAESDPSKSFILHTCRTADSGPDSLQVTSTFVNSTTIQFENYASGEGATVEWEVINGPGLRVQRGEENYGTATSGVNVSISSVNLSAAFIVVNNRLNDGTTSNNVWGCWTGKFLNETLIELRRGQTGSPGNVSWQVVEWKNASVQNGSFSGGLSGTDSLQTQVNTNNSFLIFSSTVDSGTAPDYINIGGYIVNDTAVNFYRQDGGTSTMYIEWFIIEWERLMVEKGSRVLSGTTGPFDQTINIMKNTSRTFNRHSRDSTGSGSTHADAIVSSEITNTTNLQFWKGTASRAQNASWQVIEIIELDPPVIDLEYPQNNTNFSTFITSQFNYTVIDESGIENCSLYGNWTTGWHLNQTAGNPIRNSTQNFSSVNTTTDGYYIWNVKCEDVYGNTAFGDSNYTIATFLFPDFPDSQYFNISQTSNDGSGNVTLYWNSSSHSFSYRIYYSNQMAGPFNFLGETTNINFTDASFTDSGERRRFYRVDAWNPTGQNSSAKYFGAHIYTLRHNVNTKNWIGFPTNFSYLKDANNTLNEIPNSTAVSMWNRTDQRKVTCNTYSCPSTYECTPTNCNFSFDMASGRGYEVNVNSSAPSAMNWSGVGIVLDSVIINLTKYNSTWWGKNWISMYANTTLNGAADLLENVSYADAVSRWDETSQKSQGIIHSPFPWANYLGTNFSLEIEEGYEISVNQTMLWQQI